MPIVTETAFVIGKHPANAMNQNAVYKIKLKYVK
jgi:hypothetical protein